jgi:hypothetical protein
VSRIRDALDRGNARRRPDDPHRLGQLGWLPGGTTPLWREGPGVGDYLRRGILIGAVVWVGWWLAAGRDHGEPAGGTVVTPATPERTTPATALVELPAATTRSAGTADRARDGAAETQPTAIRRDDPGPGPAAPSLPAVTAILVSEGRRLAIVDGRVLGVGERIGPWELVSVDRDAVLLRDGSGVETRVMLDHDGDP